MSDKLDLSNVSAQDLEEALAEKRETERKEKLNRKKQYEADRDSAVSQIITHAEIVSKRVGNFKKLMHEIFDEQYKQLEAYVGVPSKSKGGFSLTHSSGKFKVVRTLKSQPKWDERAQEAVQLINDFMNDKMKRTKLYDLVKALLEKNTAGDLSYPMVMRLIEHKDDYEDERWQRGMELLIESYNRVYTGYGYEFYTKNPKNGNWDKVEINFTAL